MRGLRRRLATGDVGVTKQAAAGRYLLGSLRKGAL